MVTFPVDDLINRIRSVVEPEAIYLFGSAAKGEDQIDSDLDICIIVPDSRNAREISKKLYKAMPGFGRPVDLVIVTLSRWIEHKNSIGMIYYTIDREKVPLYAALLC